MPYGKFKSVEKELIVADIFQSMMIKKLQDETSYVTEFAVCDAIIRPILDIIAANYHLKVWSHVPYHVDEEPGLVGEPDYLIAPKTKYGGMARPALCIIEVKKDDFEEGWTQALSAMVASALLGAPLCYGIVTTGAIWQIGRRAFCPRLKVSISYYGITTGI